jgi:hypothetical protein
VPIIPFRNLADLGTLTDPNPYQLPPNAWSGGSNVRYSAKKAMRAPIFRVVHDALPITPGFIAAYLPASGYDSIMVVDQQGNVYQVNATGTITNVTPTSGVPAFSSGEPWTATFLGDVLYLNNPGCPMPIYFGPNSTTFAALPNWPTSSTVLASGAHAGTTSCQVLRAFNDYLIAMNVTEGSTPATVGQLVKWSDLTLAGQVPDSWDPTDATKSAGENTIEQMTTPILDGLPLRGAFIIYTSDQVWLMQLTGTQSIFSWTMLFTTGGILNTNCVCEVNGQHYVFGVNDIYVHDGVNKQSIAQDRVKDYIFGSLNIKLSNLAFVQHMPEYDEIAFCYVSGDNDAAYTTTTGCNRAAVYNYAGNTWSFRDLPCLVGGTTANVNKLLKFSDCGLPDTFGNFGGTFYSQRDGYQLHTVFAGQSVSGLFANNRVYGYDFLNKGTEMAYPASPDGNAPAFLVRTGLDLDGEGGDLQTYKTVRRMFPQVSIFGGEPVTVQVGGQNYPSGPIQWSSSVLFDPTQDYKVDVREGGRYLAVQFSIPDNTDFEVAGFDLDVFSAGSR